MANSRNCIANSFNDSVYPPLRIRKSLIPPFLAEGARGWVSCHTERSEVSHKAQINRDISRSRAQYDKKNPSSWARILLPSLRAKHKPSWRNPTAQANRHCEQMRLC
ncbi:hypothetical protein [Helicobacter sp. T3_23-1056]